MAEDKGDEVQEYLVWERMAADERASREADRGITEKTTGDPGAPVTMEAGTHIDRCWGAQCVTAIVDNASGLPIIIATDPSLAGVSRKSW